MFGLLPHRCLLRCEDAGTPYRTGDRSEFDSIRLLMASFVRRYHLHFLCFISLLFSLFVYFLLSLLLFLFLFLLLLLAEGGVKVGRDMHSNSSATQCQRQRHRHLRQRHINAQRATRRANFNFSCSSISNSNFNCHCDCDLDLKSDFHLKSRPGQILDRVAAGAANARFCLKSQNGIRLQVKHIFVTPMCMLHVAGPISVEQPQGDGYQQIDPHAVRKYNSKLEQFISNHFIARDHKEAAGQRNLQRAQTDWRLDGWGCMYGRYNCSASTWSLQKATRWSLGKLRLWGSLLNI